MKKIVVLIILALSTKTAGAEKVSTLDRFNLWTGCEPVDLSVYVQNQDKKVMFKKEVVETIVRSKLRGLGIYDEQK